MSDRSEHGRDRRQFPLRGVDAILWRIARRLVPAAERARFQREWQAEIAHLAARHDRVTSDRVTGARVTSARVTSDWRALARAALADAWWLRRNPRDGNRPVTSRWLHVRPMPIDPPNPSTGAWTAGAAWDRLALAVEIGRRRIRRSPLFSALFVLLLAGGIAAAATVYTIAHHVVFAPLSYQQPERLVRLLLRDPDGNLDWTSWAQYQRLADDGAFDGVAASTTFPGVWRSPAGLERIQRSYVSPGYFQTLGVGAALGRLFAEGSAGTADLSEQVVLGDAFWRLRLGADESILGSSIEVDGRPRTVIGVAPAELYGHDLGNDRPQVYLVQPPAEGARRPHFRVYTLLVRLRSGQSPARAAAELDRVTANLAADRPEVYGGWSSHAEPLRAGILGDAGPSLRILLGAVVALLVVVALDLAGLMASRALSRERESALHLALGASRGFAAAQAVVEGVMLSLLGGVLGVAVTASALGVVLRLAPRLPRLDEIAWGASTVVFSALSTLAVSTLVALATLLLVRGRRPVLALRQGSGSGGGHRPVLRSLLISFQVALAVPLVLAACLLARNLLELRQRELGLEPGGVYALRVSRPPERSADRVDNARFFDDLLDRVRALPGTTAAGAVLYAPALTEEADRTRFRIEGEPERDREEAPRALLQIASTGYFETLGTRLVGGRAFGPGDRIGSSAVALVNQELVRRSFRGASPLGRRLELELSMSPGDATVREIIGVVEDQAQLGRLHEPEPMIYLPHAQSPWPSMAVILSSGLELATLQPPLRFAVRELDAEAIVEPAIALTAAFDSSLARPRGLARLLAAFAVAAITVAGLGLHATLSLQVAQRGHEIGLRMALGANRTDVARLFLLRGAALTLAGLGPGILLALGLRRVLASQLHGVSAADPIAVGATLGTLAAIALLASWLPARRAARLDPLESLRRQAE